MKVSALILTLDEEINLPRCLESLKWCDDIVVLDSYSTDRTEEIAKDYGARFIQRKFDDYSRQRNFGLKKIEYKNPWVLVVDADEIVPPDLINEIGCMLSKDESLHVSIYRMRIKYFLMNKWIRHSSGYPTWFGRLVRPDRVEIRRAINEEYHTDDQKGYLKGHLIHYPFNKGFHAWVEKHNRYSTMEAEVLASNVEKKLEWKNIFSSDPAEKRKAVKEIVYSMPFRPIIVFIGLYFFRRGFLDGRAGFTFCTLRSFYEYLIDCKIREIRLRREGKPL